MTRIYWKIQESTDNGKTWNSSFSVSEFVSFSSANHGKDFLTSRAAPENKEKYRVVRIEESIDDGEEYEVTCFSKYHYSSSWDRNDSNVFYSKSEAEEYIKKMEKLHPSWSDTVYRFELKKLK